MVEVGGTSGTIWSHSAPEELLELCSAPLPRWGWRSQEQPSDPLWSPCHLQPRSDGGNPGLQLVPQPGTGYCWQEPCSVLLYLLVQIYGHFCHPPELPLSQTEHSLLCQLLIPSELLHAFWWSFIGLSPACPHGLSCTVGPALVPILQLWSHQPSLALYAS